MSDTKFSRGPWTLVTRFAEAGDVYGDAEIHAPTRYPLYELEICDENTRANAHLAAAAPELYEALTLVSKEWEHNAPSDCYSTGPLTGNLIRDHVACPGCAVQRAVEAALAKARGEA